MSKVFIEIEQKEYELKFGYGCIKNMCQAYGKERLSEIDSIIKVLMIEEGTEPSFEWFDVFGTLILSAIKYASAEEISFSKDAVIEAIMFSDEAAGKSAEILEAFANGLPQTKKVTGKKATSKKVGKQKRS